MSEGRPRGDGQHRSLVGDLIGSVEPTDPPFTPPLRIAVEFFGALFGFPGLGWMISGRISVGLPLLVLVPAALWMLFPLFVSSAHLVLKQPLGVLAVLPPIAIASAGALAHKELART